MSNQPCIYVDIHTSMKKAPRTISHLIIRNPLSLKARNYQVTFKVKTPMFKLSSLASSSTNDPSSWKYTSTATISIFPTMIYETSSTNDPSSWKYTSAATISIFPTMIYETHLQETFKTNSSIFNHRNRSFCKKGDTSFPSMRYSVYRLIDHVIIIIALQHCDNLRYEISYTISSLGLKSSLLDVRKHTQKYPIGVFKLCHSF